VPAGLASQVGLVGWLASWARRLTGQVGRMDLFFYQFDLIQYYNLNSNTNSFLNSNQIPNLKYL
jgi:hypothetical protein